MNKVIKIIFHAISAVVLTSIVLPLLLALLLYLPFVQNFAVKKAADWAGRKLGTTVTFDNIHIKFVSRVVIDGFYVEDLNGDPMLYVEQLDVSFPPTNFLSGGLSLGTVVLENPTLQMYQEADSTSTFKKILEKLKNDKPKEDKKPFRMTASNVLVKNMEFSHHKLEIRDREGGVNFDDLHVTGFNLHASSFILDDQDISLDIEFLSLKDKSGFIINAFSAEKVFVSPQAITLDQFKIATPESRIDISDFKLLSGDWEAYQQFLEDVSIEAKITNSYVDFYTIGHFAPKLKEWGFAVSGLSGQVSGPVAAMKGNIDKAAIADTDLSFRFNITGLPEIDRTIFNIRLNELSTNAQDANMILSGITRKPLDGGLTNIIAQLGIIDVNGVFEGSLKNFVMDGNLATPAGAADFVFHMSPGIDNRSDFQGNLNLHSAGLGRLLGTDNIGRVDITANMKGSFAAQDMEANTNAVLTRMDFNGYSYEDIAMNGYFRNRQFKGNISSQDPNLRFDFDGMLDFNDSIPAYDFDMRLYNANLAALGINKRDSVSLLKSNIRAIARGTTIDDLNGKITIDDMLYVNHIDSVTTGRITIAGENYPDSKYISLRSSFADADYRSKTSYTQVISDMKEMLHSYMPTLAPENETALASDFTIADVNNYSLLNVNVKEANNVAGIFVPGLVIAKDSRLSFMFNPNIEQFTLTASSDYIEKDRNFVSKLDINTRNQSDSVSLFIRAEALYTAGFYLPDFSVIAGMRDNQINATTRFTNKETDISALIGVATILGRDSVSGIPNAAIRFTPSTLKRGDNTWNIFTRGIVADSTKITVNNFTVTGQGQSLVVNGIASREKTDTLHVSLNNFDLEPLTQFTTRMGYHITGTTNGHADFMSALEDGLMYASITFDSVKVNDVSLPDGLFESAWDFERERAFFMLSAREYGDTVIRGYYNPADSRYLADVNIDGLDLSLLDPLFENVVSGTSGKAVIAATVTGASSAPKINGSATIQELTTKVDFLNVPYRLSNTVIDVKDNVLSTTNASIRDPLGNSAGMDMTVNLNSLSNIVFDMNIRPRDLMVLNTTENDNDIFYGRVFASGTASIKGDKRGVNMDIVASTSGNSQFFLPLSGSSSMGVSDIITFVNPQRRENADTSEYLVRKRMIMERGQRRGRNRAQESNMNIKMALNVLPNTDFQLLIDPRVGDILRGKGIGSLTMNINPSNDEFTMFGDYEITEGSYQFTLQDIISKRFTIEEGSKITWTGDPADALLDVTAVYRLRASLAPLDISEDLANRRTVPVECRVMLGDRLSQPSVTFNVEVPGAEPYIQSLVANALGTQESMATQFFFLIAANSFYSDAGAGAIGAASGSATAFEFLTNQIGNLMSTDKFNIGIRYSPKTDLTSNEVNIDFSTQLFSNRLLLEVEGSFDAGDNKDVTYSRNASNLTGDFYLTWLIDRAGSLRAKGFTRTIDRFEEKGLQESGIGLYYKEDFNNFNDIVRNFKDRFSGWGRKKKNNESLKTDEEDEDAGLEKPDTKQKEND